VDAQAGGAFLAVDEDGVLFHDSFKMAAVVDPRIRQA
jgi:hypothetical protein